MSARSSTAATDTRRPSDHWNPVLVKEVRQALRGRTFRFTFLGALAAALLASLTVTARFEGTPSASEVQGYFFSIYLCLATALIGIVPFGAFQAMGSEWEEHTFDQLSLSSLRPGRIVLGKLQGAGVQALLFLSGFVPFLTIGLLLPGIDVMVAALTLALTLCVSVLATVVGVGLSTLSRQRFVRVLLMVGLGILVSMAISGMVGFTTAAMHNPREFRSAEALTAIGWMAALGLVTAAYMFTFACNMLAHPEENRSTNVRLVTSGAVLFLLVAVWRMAFVIPGAGFIATMTLAGFSVASLLGVLLVTEPRGLGRRARLGVPRSRVVALVTLPWYPGGGRGVLFLILHLGAIAGGGLLLVRRFRPIAANPLEDGVGALILAVPICLLYATLVPGVFARLCEQTPTRRIVRLATPIVLLLGILLPGLVGALFDDRALGGFKHVGNPFWILEWTWSRNALPMGMLGGYAGLAGLALTVNLPRIVAALRETLAASTENEARAEARAHGASASASMREGEVDAVARG